jgi:hypothetical protein
MDDVIKGLVALVTGPAGAVVLAVFALWKLWGRIEKMIDNLQQLVADNTKAMQAMRDAADSLAKEVRELPCTANGVQRTPQAVSKVG